MLLNSLHLKFVHYSHSLKRSSCQYGLGPTPFMSPYKNWEELPQTHKNCYMFAEEGEEHLGVPVGV